MTNENKTPAPESHATGTGVGIVTGAASGASIGAAAGAAAGPAGASAGAVVGGVVGAVVGGIAGNTIAELVNPAEEEHYWQQHFRDRPYAGPDADFDTYRHAYRYGYESRAQFADRDFHEIEGELKTVWEANQADHPLNWEAARDAVRDSYDRTGQQYKVRLQESERVSRTA